MITYVRHPNLTLDDDRISCELCANYFHNIGESEQINVNDWDFETTKMFPYSWTVIKKDNEQIGYTFILPASKKLMNLFLKDEITENELSKSIKEEVTQDNFDAIYLCASVIKPEYENRGYAVHAMKDSIEKMIEERDIDNIELFA